MDKTWEKNDELKSIIDYNIDREEAIYRAKKEGLVVIDPKKNELLLDIDTVEQLKLFEQRMEYLEQFFAPKWQITISQSGPPHCHIRVKLDIVVDNMERLFLQLFLGSDPVREFLSYIRILSGEKHPTLLLQKPNQKVDNDLNSCNSRTKLRKWLEENNKPIKSPFDPRFDDLKDL